MWKRMAAMAALVSALAGCSTVKGWFAGKNAEAKKATEPAELVDFEPTVRPSRLWSVDLGDGERRVGTRQVPAIADGRVYAAAGENELFALDLHTGKRVWRHRVEYDKKTDKGGPIRLAGSPGVGEGLVAVGSLGGDVLVLDAATGAERWRARVSSEVIAPPAIAMGLVFVRSNDGRISAFDAATGERRWFRDHELPSLTVRGNAPLTIGPGVLFSGNDDGTVTAMAMNDGRVLWELPVGLPEGRSELERMADVDGAPVLEDTTLYASSYKNRTLAIDGPSGRPMWQSEHGGAGGIGVSASYLVVANASGTVYALDKNSGAAMWSQDALARRSLTGPAVHGDYAVVGDFEGYLHWLRLEDGALAARARVGRKAIKGQPQVADGILVVQNIRGDLAAFRLD
jgi:outer membrane assembly lipoprotein YfgL